MLKKEMVEEHSIIHHQNRVTHYVQELLRFIDFLSEEEKDLCIRAAMVHDIGKFIIPDRILFKKGMLTIEEYNIVKTHVVIGEEMLIRDDREIARIVRHHHERWDGKGYPDGLQEEDIPITSRIIAICDSWDAMLSDRPYRKGMNFKEALQEMKRCSGTQFDEEILAVFLKNKEKFQPQKNNSF